MTLSDSEKLEIIGFVNDTFEGNSTVDEDDTEFIVFTFDKGEIQPSIGTDSILELLKRGYFVLYSTLNEEGHMEIAITNGDGFKL